MPVGSLTVHRPRKEVVERLRLILAAANCQVLSPNESVLHFRHGTYLTETATLLPKEGTLTLSEDGTSTRIYYHVSVLGPAKVWMIFVAVVFCWLVFPPILVYYMLVHHPRKFIENILAGVC